MNRTEKKISPETLNDEEMKAVAGGAPGSDIPNPMTLMLDMYYQTAMEQKDPAARAEAARVYNQTLEEMKRNGINCAGYRHIQC